MYSKLNVLIIVGNKLRLWKYAEKTTKHIYKKANIIARVQIF
tara:strand:- start:38 stop:163 length:126 start_codon:yes stop_codon:yes gene_type:complete